MVLGPGGCAASAAGTVSVRCIMDLISQPLPIRSDSEVLRTIPLDMYQQLKVSGDYDLSGAETWDLTLVSHPSSPPMRSVPRSATNASLSTMYRLRSSSSRTQGSPHLEEASFPYAEPDSNKSRESLSNNIPSSSMEGRKWHKLTFRSKQLFKSMSSSMSSTSSLSLAHSESTLPPSSRSPDHLGSPPSSQASDHPLSPPPLHTIFSPVDAPPVLTIRATDATSMVRWSEVISAHFSRADQPSMRSGKRGAPMYPSIARALPGSEDMPSKAESGEKLRSSKSPTPFDYMQPSQKGYNAPSSLLARCRRRASADLISRLASRGASSSATDPRDSLGHQRKTSMSSMTTTSSMMTASVADHSLPESTPTFRSAAKDMPKHTPLHVRRSTSSNLVGQTGRPAMTHPESYADHTSTTDIGGSATTSGGPREIPLRSPSIRRIGDHNRQSPTISSSGSSSPGSPRSPQSFAELSVPRSVPLKSAIETDMAYTSVDQPAVSSSQALGLGLDLGRRRSLTMGHGLGSMRRAKSSDGMDERPSSSAGNYTFDTETIHESPSQEDRLSEQDTSLKRGSSSKHKHSRSYHGEHPEYSTRPISMRRNVFGAPGMDGLASSCSTTYIGAERPKSSSSVLQPTASIGAERPKSSSSVLQSTASIGAERPKSSSSAHRPSVSTSMERPKSSSAAQRSSVPLFAPDDNPVSIPRRNSSRIGASRSTASLLLDDYSTPMLSQESPSMRLLSSFVPFASPRTKLQGARDMLMATAKRRGPSTKSANESGASATPEDVEDVSDEKAPSQPVATIVPTQSPASTPPVVERILPPEEIIATIDRLRDETSVEKEHQSNDLATNTYGHFSRARSLTTPQLLSASRPSTSPAIYSRESLDHASSTSSPYRSPNVDKSPLSYATSTNEQTSPLTLTAGLPASSPTVPRSLPVPPRTTKKSRSFLDAATGACEPSTATHLAPRTYRGKPYGSAKQAAASSSSLLLLGTSFSSPYIDPIAAHHETDKENHTASDKRLAKDSRNSISESFSNALAERNSAHSALV